MGKRERERGVKISILVPQYREGEEVVKPLLDSIGIQQGVDFGEVEVIIVNDGTEVRLSEEFLGRYPYRIVYSTGGHKGVSGTRNSCLAKASGELVMFCDADDMFYSVSGIRVILDEYERAKFDTLAMAFAEEVKGADGKSRFLVHTKDSTFVHGKVHRREYLEEQGIKWCEELTVHEDSYFNVLCQTLTDKAKFSEEVVYLWKYRADSVCRRDSEYLLKTFPDMIKSNTRLVEELARRGYGEHCEHYATSMIYNTYYTMQKDEWCEEKNAKYREALGASVAEYIRSFSVYFNNMDKDRKMALVKQVRSKMFDEGLGDEKQTFREWLLEVVGEGYGGIRL